jgi:hypothetical protein
VVSGFKDKDPDAVLLVDVGGNTGHEIQAIRQRFPALSGRMVLQDLPSTIEQVQSNKDMEAMEHNFFTPQPVQGISSQPLSISPVLTHPDRGPSVLPPQHPPRLG